MDGLSLLHQAKEAGLAVTLDGGRLVIRGPKRAEPVARLLIEHKSDVLAVFVRADRMPMPANIERQNAAEAQAWRDRYVSPHRTLVPRWACLAGSRTAGFRRIDPYLAPGARRPTRSRPLCWLQRRPAQWGGPNPRLRWDPRPSRRSSWRRLHHRLRHPLAWCCGGRLAGAWAASARRLRTAMSERAVTGTSVDKPIRS
jgi:hypothetical protein